MVLIKDFRLKHFRFYALFFGGVVFFCVVFLFFFFQDSFQLKCFRVLKNTRCPAHNVREEPQSLPLPPREISCSAGLERLGKADGMARRGLAGRRRARTRAGCLQRCLVPQAPCTIGNGDSGS